MPSLWDTPSYDLIRALHKSEFSREGISLTAVHTERRDETFLAGELDGIGLLHSGEGIASWDNLRRLPINRTKRGSGSNPADDKPVKKARIGRSRDPAVDKPVKKVPDVKPFKKTPSSSSSKSPSPLKPPTLPKSPNNSRRRNPADPADVKPFKKARYSSSFNSPESSNHSSSSLDSPKAPKGPRTGASRVLVPSSSDAEVDSRSPRTRAPSPEGPMTRGRLKRVRLGSGSL